MRFEISTFLESCPFCGGNGFVDPIYHDERKHYPWHARVVCEDCLAAVGATGFAQTEKEAVVGAIKAWNKRVDRSKKSRSFDEEFKDFVDAFADCLGGYK